MTIVTYLPRRRRPLPYTLRLLLRIAAVAFAAGLAAGLGFYMLAPL